MQRQERRPMLDWTVEEINNGRWHYAGKISARSRDAASYQWMEQHPGCPRFRVVPAARQLTDSGLPVRAS